MLTETKTRDELMEEMEDMEPLERIKHLMLNGIAPKDVELGFHEQEEEKMELELAEAVEDVFEDEWENELEEVPAYFPELNAVHLGKPETFYMDWIGKMDERLATSRQALRGEVTFDLSVKVQGDEIKGAVTDLLTEVMHSPPIIWTRVRQEDGVMMSVPNVNRNTLHSVMKCQYHLNLGFVAASNFAMAENDESAIESLMHVSSIIDDAIEQVGLQLLFDLENGWDISLRVNPDEMKVHNDGAWPFKDGLPVKMLGSVSELPCVDGIRKLTIDGDVEE